MTNLGHYLFGPLGGEPHFIMTEFLIFGFFIYMTDENITKSSQFYITANDNRVILI